jgi:hypothetical protein
MEMKRMITDQIPTEYIYVDNLTRKEIVAYRCAGVNDNNKVAVLSKISLDGAPMFGFIPLGEPQDRPRFVASNWRAAISNVLDKQSDIFVFNSVVELCNFIKSIQADK